jgi:hypothetical protein
MLTTDLLPFQPDTMTPAQLAAEAVRLPAAPLVRLVPDQCPGSVGLHPTSRLVVVDSRVTPPDARSCPAVKGASSTSSAATFTGDGGLHRGLTQLRKWYS